MYSREVLKEEINHLLWDTQRDADYYLSLMDKKVRDPEENRILITLYIKILNYNRWHKIVKMFDYQTLKNEVVTDMVIQGLFPRPLRKKYKYVQRLL